MLLKEDYLSWKSRYWKNAYLLNFSVGSGDRPPPLMGKRTLVWLAVVTDTGSELVEPTPRNPSADHLSSNPACDRLPHCSSFHVFALPNSTRSPRKQTGRKSQMCSFFLFFSSYHKFRPPTLSMRNKDWLWSVIHHLLVSDACIQHTFK